MDFLFWELSSFGRFLFFFFLLRLRDERGRLRSIAGRSESPTQHLQGAPRHYEVGLRDRVRAHRGDGDEGRDENRSWACRVSVT